MKVHIPTISVTYSDLVRTDCQLDDSKRLRNHFLPKNQEAIPVWLGRYVHLLIRADMGNQVIVENNHQYRVLDCFSLTMRNRTANGFSRV
jgi:hypothetical protein